MESIETQSVTAAGRGFARTRTPSTGRPIEGPVVPMSERIRGVALMTQSLANSSLAC